MLDIEPRESPRAVVWRHYPRHPRRDAFILSALACYWVYTGLGLDRWNSPIQRTGMHEQSCWGLRYLYHASDRTYQSLSRLILSPASGQLLKAPSLIILSFTCLIVMLRAVPSLRFSLLTRSLATHAATPTTPTALARHDWTKEEVKQVYDTPLLELVFRAASVHRQHHDPSKIQLCTLMNIKSE